MSASYNILGMMSGSSLDGLDLAFCEFNVDKAGKWAYTILNAETVSYPRYWQNFLMELPLSTGLELIEKDISYGNFLGEIAKTFLTKHQLKADFISSHGHTIFHQPEKAFTFQLGNGQALATASGLTAICDFRSKDISLGGQGAPLVPVGDELLFAEFDLCLNLGGIANISFKRDGLRVAHDVCPANQLLNFLSKQKNRDFDEDGNLASGGLVNNELLEFLNKNQYYAISSPKSLSNQYVQQSFIGGITSFDETVENKLRTCTEHIVQQIHRDTKEMAKGKLLATGGGAHNTFLIRRLREISKHEIIVPEKKLIDFKEALVFAFMGVLRLRGEANSLASVTGATKNSSGGVIFYP
jgi:anhydro-N-acetylmuramic acid kinase